MPTQNTSILTLGTIPTFLWSLEMLEPQACQLLFSEDPIFIPMGWANTIFNGCRKILKIKKFGKHCGGQRVPMYSWVPGSEEGARGKYVLVWAPPGAGARGPASVWGFLSWTASPLSSHIVDNPIPLLASSFALYEIRG